LKNLEQTNTRIEEIGVSKTTFDNQEILRDWITSTANLWQFRKKVFDGDKLYKADKEALLSTQRGFKLGERLNKEFLLSKLDKEEPLDI
jgi:hypothetical protein